MNNGIQFLYSIMLIQTFVHLTFQQTAITWGCEIPASLFYSSENHPSKSGLLHLWMKQFSSFAAILAGNLLNAELPLVILVSTLLTDWSFFVPTTWDLSTEGYAKGREYRVFEMNHYVFNI